MSELCKHEMVLDQCGLCRPRPGAVDLGTDRHGSPVGNTDAVLKQDSLTSLCRLLGIAPLKIGVGSSVPSQVFDAMVRRFGVPDGSMPIVGEAVCRKAEIPWDASCDSRGSLSAGGSTVTGVGLERLVQAVAKLNR